MNGAANFIITTDHRIEFALLSAFSEIDGEFFQRLTQLFRIRVIDLLASTNFFNCIRDFFLGQPELFEQGSKWTFIFQSGEEINFRGDVGILTLLRNLITQIKQRAKRRRELYITTNTTDFG
ncbi:Uncharacterised protein [Vibrio cholerae]|nr:Uncharacterised protein [Vibrio cholerae]CSB05358.1 Uncharacterised protein [Vibrio cholerae]CSC57200.1 Uncharacterised protein [Vibrio cholerae]